MSNGALDATGFRDAQRIRAASDWIREAAGALKHPLRIMEVCGGHTFAIVKYGLDQLLPETIRFIHGPGCPVCVLPRHRIDAAVALARRPGTILVTLGDMLRVPGSTGSLQQARAAGRDVRFVYSPLDALRIARDNPACTIVYFAIGFETTAPMTALLLEQTRRAGVKNLCVHLNHVLIPPAMHMLLEQGGAIDAFIGPGHVTAITGTAIYRPLADRHRTPIVIAGFEPLDILDAVLRIVRQHDAGHATVENAYARSVRPQGNAKARQLVERYFTLSDSFIWRGLGALNDSALCLRADYAGFDAEQLFPEECPTPSEEQPSACLCGEILMGRAEPRDCALFAGDCTPQTPQGSCMVSNEGACAAYYRYRRM